MGLIVFVEVIGVVTVHRSGIDTPVNFEQRHANFVEVAISQSPKAAMRISVFRADTWVHHKSAYAWNGEYFLFQDELAAREHDVWPQFAKKLFCLGGVRARGVQHSS